MWFPPKRCFTIRRLSPKPRRQDRELVRQYVERQHRRRFDKSLHARVRRPLVRFILRRSMPPGDENARCIRAKGPARGNPQLQRTFCGAGGLGLSDMPCGGRLRLGQNPAIACRIPAYPGTVLPEHATSARVHYIWSASPTRAEATCQSASAHRTEAFTVGCLSPVLEFLIGCLPPHTFVRIRMVVIPGIAVS